MSWVVVKVHIVGFNRTLPICGAPVTNFGVWMVIGMDLDTRWNALFRSVLIVVGRCELVEIGLVGRRVWGNCFRRHAEMRKTLFLIVSDAIRQSTVAFSDSLWWALSKMVLSSLSLPDLVELQVVFALWSRPNRSLNLAETGSWSSVMLSWFQNCVRGWFRCVVTGSF